MKKYELLKPFIYNAFDILLVLEIKIDISFPSTQFNLLEQSFEGGLCIYVNDSIPLKQLNLHKDNSEIIFLKSNLLLRIWLIVGYYKRLGQSKSVFKKVNFKKCIL